MGFLDFLFKAEQKYADEHLLDILDETDEMDVLGEAEEMDEFDLRNQFEEEDNDFSCGTELSFDDQLDDSFVKPEPWKSMTADYYGKHGEFDNNDEDRAICEEMFGMKAQCPDVDLEEHFGWENKLNYDTDGYSDLECE